MAILLGFDLETTGLTIGKIGVTEIGMAVWDTELRTPIKMFGAIVDPGQIVWEPGTEKVSGLTPEICAKYGMADEKALRQVLSWYSNADVAVAHNAYAFDRLVLQAWSEKYGLDWQPSKIWIDTSVDIELPEKNSTRLTYMAADHGFINPLPHRALTDVLTMLKILDSYDINVVLESAKTPNVTLQALVSYDDRALAKKRSYRWQPETKTWTKQVKANKVSQEEKEAGFAIRVLS